MSLLAEISGNLKASAAFLTLSQTAAESFGNTRAAARRSFITLVWRLPFYLTLGYYSNLPFLQRFEASEVEFLAGRVVAFFLILFLTLSAVQMLCKWQELEGNFYRWVVAFNWGNILLDLILLPVMLATAFISFSHDQRVIIGIGSYLFMLYFMWAMSWRVLKCNPFYAAGIAIMPFFMTGMVTDYLNYKLYGHTKPFFAPISAEEILKP
jgi:hypothetical protein